MHQKLTDLSNFWLHPDLSGLNLVRALLTSKCSALEMKSHDLQDTVNRSVYTAANIPNFYRSTVLEPVEIACLLRYQPCIFEKRVLDIGVGTGRTTRYLAPLAAHYEAVDYSPVMIGHLQENMPEIPAHLVDFRDLSMFPDCSFDFLFATNNVIDALPHLGRLQALGEAYRVLRPGGTLALSSHNLSYSRSFSGPHLDWSPNPVRLAAFLWNYLMGIWNHARVGRLRETRSEFALLNDPGHQYACLHYYASRATVTSQLEGAGFRVETVFDPHGRILPLTADDCEFSSLMYVSERLPPQPTELRV